MPQPDSNKRTWRIRPQVRALTIVGASAAVLGWRRLLVDRETPARGAWRYPMDPGGQGRAHPDLRVAVGSRLHQAVVGERQPRQPERCHAGPAPHDVSADAGVVAPGSALAWHDLHYLGQSLKGTTVSGSAAGVVAWRARERLVWCVESIKKVNTLDMSQRWDIVQTRPRLAGFLFAAPLPCPYLLRTHPYEEVRT